jgi:hypothetical protein
MSSWLGKRRLLMRTSLRRARARSHHRQARAILRGSWSKDGGSGRACRAHWLAARGGSPCRALREPRWHGHTSSERATLFFPASSRGFGAVRPCGLRRPPGALPGCSRWSHGRVEAASSYTVAATRRSDSRGIRRSTDVDKGSLWPTKSQTRRRAGGGTGPSSSTHQARRGDSVISCGLGLNDASRPLISQTAKRDTSHLS